MAEKVQLKTKLPLLTDESDSKTINMEEPRDVMTEMSLEQYERRTADFSDGPSYKVTES